MEGTTDYSADSCPYVQCTGTLKATDELAYRSDTLIYVKSLGHIAVTARSPPIDNPKAYAKAALPTSEICGARWT
jgi:hypothetical protein